jgi:hypothetical protein
MKKLDHAGLLELRQRFGSMHDGWITSVELEAPDQFVTVIRIRVEVTEFPEGFEGWNSETQLQWRELFLELRGVDAFSFQQRPNHIFGLIFEAGIDFAGNRVFVDFDYSERAKVHDALSELLKSSQYVLASELWWEVRNKP